MYVVSPRIVVDEPRTGNVRAVRMLGMLAFLFLFICALVYALWLIAGVLDEEPMRAMVPNAEMSQMTDVPAGGSALTVPADILSSAMSHPGGPRR